MRGDGGRHVSCGARKLGFASRPGTPYHPPMLFLLSLATESEAPSFRVKPLPAYTEAQVAGFQEAGMRVVIRCGGCAGSAP